MSSVKWVGHARRVSEKVIARIFLRGTI